MATNQARCPFCGSEETNKRFLGIPDVFGFGPGLVGGVILLGGLIAVLHGLARVPSEGNAPANWLVEILVGAFVAVLAFLGLLAKSHTCKACKRRFNWPPVFAKKLKLTCPKCGAPLRGATSQMIGDIAVCAKCQHEFEIPTP